MVRRRTTGPRFFGFDTWQAQELDSTCAGFWSIPRAAWVEGAAAGFSFNATLTRQELFYWVSTLRCSCSRRPGLRFFRHRPAAHHRTPTQKGCCDRAALRYSVSSQSGLHYLRRLLYHRKARQRGKDNGEQSGGGRTRAQISGAVARCSKRSRRQRRASSLRRMLAFATPAAGDPIRRIRRAPAMEYEWRWFSAWCGFRRSRCRRRGFYPCLS